MDTLQRYTELPFVLHALQSKKLTLLSPGSWDDKNDSHFVQKYREKKELKSVLALCLTEAAQTYHHWKVFTHGASGACIYFKKEMFEAWIEETPQLIGRSVIYKTVPQLLRKPPELCDLPFLKRKAYEHEAEYRLLYQSSKSSATIRSFKFPVNMIQRVIINPWLPQATVKSMETLIHSIKDCENLEVVRATIIRNDEWRKIADSAAL